MQKVVIVLLLALVAIQAIPHNHRRHHGQMRQSEEDEQKHQYNSRSRTLQPVYSGEQSQEDFAMVRGQKTYHKYNDESYEQQGRGRSVQNVQRSRSQHHSSNSDDWDF